MAKKSAVSKTFQPRLYIWKFSIFEITVIDSLGFKTKLIFE